MDREKYNLYMRKYHAEHKDIINKRRRENIDQNREVYNAKQRIYNHLHPEMLTEYSRRARAKHPQFNHAHTASKYGLSYLEHDRLFIKQDGRCTICEKDQCELSTPLIIDHDHTTGKIRGLLCQSCNILLIKFDKIPDVANRIIRYLTLES